MSSGIIAALDEILQSLPPHSVEATKLSMIITVLSQMLPLAINTDHKKLLEELVTERRMRREAEEGLERCRDELRRTTGRRD